MSSDKLLTVQVLRALAAAAVVAYHTLFMLTHNAGYSFAVSDIGASGVDLFFVISGFIMIYTSHDAFQKPRAAREFLRRRVIRVVPLYWLYTTLVILLMLFLPKLFSTLAFDWERAVSSYFFILTRDFRGVDGVVLQTGWTLCYEMYFYAVFALLLFFRRQYFLPALGGIFLGGILLGSSVAVPVGLSVATNPLLMEFYFGAIIAFAYLRGWHLQPAWAWLVVALGIAVILCSGGLSFGPWTRVVVWGLPGAMLLAGMISLEKAGLKAPKVAVALGDSSYSLYLCHPFVLPAFGKVWLVLGLGSLPAAFLFLAAFSASIIAGHVSYLLLERPLTRWLSRKWRSKPAQQPDAYAPAP